MEKNSSEGYKYQSWEKTGTKFVTFGLHKAAFKIVLR